ncbi:MAG: molybdenum cofactor biosynthesis protein B [Thermomicrobiales bacterium]
MAVLTVSDTRREESDTGGALIRELIRKNGHEIADQRLIPDEEALIRQVVHTWGDDKAIDAIIVTGGTGLAPRDRTYEALAPILDRTIGGFGELFRMLSYQEIGPAAMLSRAFAGVVGDTVVFALPGSRNAIALAMTKLILPEIGHVVSESRKRSELDEKTA